MTVTIHLEVRDTLAAGGAVVALESTIFSHLGLPSPANAEALARCLRIIRASGAVPAVTAVIDGVARVGLDASEHDRILGPARKAGEREVAIAVAQRWAVGATTVSASLLLAHAAGIGVFATGGIGGVHRDAHVTGDISADLGAIAAHPVVTVCAGAKSFLDLPRTLEHLETLGVPVLGLATDDLPAFTVRSSGIPIPARVETVDELAAVVSAHRALGRRGGLLACVPVPEAEAVDAATVYAAIDAALADATERGIGGAAVTPHVLSYIARATGGESVTANLALAENNARVAAELAVALTR
jgi:pseudouridine-5'-phosphate glycosidase